MLLFARGKTTKLGALKPDTRDYFLKLPGHDTLRLILSKRIILVEGPSDDLIVQRAFLDKHKVLPLEGRVDVISVGSLAFKRFKIAELLDVKVDVLADNDEDTDAVKEKYKDYLGRENIKIQFDEDVKAPSLEQQLLKANGIKLVNDILGKKFKDEPEAIKYMRKNKTECALKFFETKFVWKAPEYIARAIEQ